MKELPIIPVKSKRARRVALRLDTRNRHFKLVIPKGMTEGRALVFATKHRDWMLEKLAALPERINYNDGIELPIFGQYKTLDIFFDDARKTTKIDMDEDFISVKTNKDDPSPRIERFLRKITKDHLWSLSREKADIINKEVRSVSVRDTSSRWGSCSPDGNLSYSWRLVFAPDYVIDYIVAHEVAHLKHLDHSSDFWHTCKHLSNQFKEGKKWIRDNGHSLMRYG